MAAKEGADLILAPSAEVVAAVNAKISVPVFTPPADGWAGLSSDGVAALVEAGAQGVAMTSAPPVLSPRAIAAAAGGAVQVECS